MVSVDFSQLESFLFGLRLDHHLVPPCEIGGHVVIGIANLQEAREGLDRPLWQRMCIL